MTEKDIKKLEEVTKNRFKLLVLQLKNRKKDLYAAAEARLKQLYEEEIARAEEVREELQRDIDEMQARAEEIFRKGLDLERRLTDEGIGVRFMRQDGSYAGHAHRANNPIQWSYHYQNRFEWYPVGYKAKLKDATEQIDKLIRDAEEQLELRRLEILEKLAVGMLQTEDAKKYVEQIPEIMELVPDSALPQITKG